MKNVHNRTRNLGELNLDLGVTFNTDYWAFIFARVGYPEIVFDAASAVVTYPEFVPLEDLLRDVIRGLDRDQVVACEECRGLFDIGEEDGIFGDPEKLEGFLCRRCSETTSARDFYYKHLRTGR